MPIKHCKGEISDLTRAGRNSPAISARIRTSTVSRTVSRFVVDPPLASARTSISLSLNDVLPSLRFGAPEFCV